MGGAPPQSFTFVCFAALPHPPTHRPSQSLHCWMRQRMTLGGAEVLGGAGVPRPQARCRGQSVALHTGSRPTRSCYGDAGDEIGLVVGTSLAVQWLGPGPVTAGSPGSIPGRGPKIPEVTWRGQKEHAWSLSQQSIPGGEGRGWEHFSVNRYSLLSTGHGGRPHLFEGVWGQYTWNLMTLWCLFVNSALIGATLSKRQGRNSLIFCT